MIPDKGNKQDIDLSIIIPVKDEAQNIAGLAGELEIAISPESWSWECLWVDDGSTDGTQYELERINKRDKHHKYITLSRNYGQSAALSIGFAYARGKILATLDGDGQNDPKSIPILVRRLIEDNADMINGWRMNRCDTFVRKTSSWIANAFRNWITQDQVKDVGCSLRVFRHQCVENIPVFNGMHRFLPTLVRMGGYSKIIEIPVTHRPRKYGQTKYGINNRLWVGLMDTIAVRWMKSRMTFPEAKGIVIK